MVKMTETEVQYAIQRKDNRYRVVFIIPALGRKNTFVIGTSILKDIYRRISELEEEGLRPFDE